MPNDYKTLGKNWDKEVSKGQKKNKFQKSQSDLWIRMAKRLSEWLAINNADLDDVLEFANLSAFPIAGETGKAYVAIDSGKIYRWTGSAYEEISAGGGDASAKTKAVAISMFLN
jgi:hypothetical protein